MAERKIAISPDQAPLFKIEDSSGKIKIPWKREEPIPPIIDPENAGLAHKVKMGPILPSRGMKDD